MDNAILFEKMLIAMVGEDELVERISARSTKVCPKCNKGKLVAEFHKQKTGTLGRQCYCIECAREITKKRNRLNRARNTELTKAWKESNRERLAMQAKEYKLRNPEKRLAHSKVRTEVRYNRWPAASTMVCEVCKEALAIHWHHHLGYEPEHWLHAIAICADCHAREHANMSQGAADSFRFDGSIEDDHDFIRHGGS